MGAADVMQQLRKGGYGKNEVEKSAIDTPSGGRLLSLTAEELKEVPTTPDGDEICLSVYGTLTKSGFQVSRVESEEAETPDESDSKEVMSRLD